MMKDYKLKQRNLRASHTLGWSVTLGSRLFFYSDANKLTYRKVRVLKMETKIKQSLEQRRQGTVPVLSALGDWSWSLLTHAHIHCCPASLDCLVASVSIVLPEGRAIAPAAPFSSRPRRYGDR